MQIARARNHILVLSGAAPAGIGGLTEIEEQHERLITKGPDKVSAFTIPKLMLNAASGHVSIRYGLRGPNYAVATACASATNAMGDAFKAIQYDDADIMMTGGTEAACTPMGLVGGVGSLAVDAVSTELPVWFTTLSLCSVSRETDSPCGKPGSVCGLLRSGDHS